MHYPHTQLYIYMLYILACDAGTYGQGCNETCAYCLDRFQCDHITGECSDQCQSGYIGIMCDAGILVYHKTFGYLLSHGLV